MWSDFDVLWRRTCSVLCTMYEHGQEVMREWLLHGNRQPKRESSWGRPRLLLVKRPGWELTLGTRKSTSWEVEYDAARSMRDSLNCSFIGGGSEGGRRSVHAGMYQVCIRGMCVCVRLWGRLWGLDWNMIGCGYEVVRCNWFSDTCCLPLLHMSLERVWSVWPPPPWHPSAYLSVFHVFEVHTCASPPISTTVEVATHLLSVVLQGPCVPLSAHWQKVHVVKVVQSRAIHYRCRFVRPPVQVGGWEKCRREGGGIKRTQWIHANSVDESISNTGGYTNLPNIWDCNHKDSHKLSVCVYVRACMCLCVSVGKTLSGVYVCVFVCVWRVFGRVLGRASSYVCLCVCIDVFV